MSAWTLDNMMVAPRRRGLRRRSRSRESPRIQFDIERNRPATLVVVPERAGDEPQVLAIPPSEYRAAAETLVALGLVLAEMASGETPEDAH